MPMKIAQRASGKPACVVRALKAFTLTEKLERNTFAGGERQVRGGVRVHVVVHKVRSLFCGQVPEVCLHHCEKRLFPCLDHVCGDGGEYAENDHNKRSTRSG